MHIFAVLFAFVFSFSPSVVQQIQTMPVGGRYSGKSDVVARYNGVDPQEPSFCSGATYSVFLKVVRASGVFIPSEVLAVRNQVDGEGVWGRWNANGPGTARLFFETGAGINFIEWEKAQPGDFMKIWWTEEVGALEHGHSVIFLESSVDTVTFWSSNIPNGYGIKTVLRSRVRHVIFSRLISPALLNTQIPASDPYLAGLLKQRSSFAEACDMTGVFLTKK